MSHKTRIVLLIVWILVIFVLTGFSKLKTPRIMDIPVDKLYHFIVFVLLGILELRTLNATTYLIVGITVAILSELQQVIIPGRNFEFLDMLAGIAGLLTVYIIGKRKDIIRHDVSKT